MIYRPLIFFIIELFLAIYVYKHGKFLPKRIAAFLLFLSLYQLGEAIILLTDYDKFGASFAYFSTTILPAIGVYIIEGTTGKKLGSTVFFSFFGAMACVFLLRTDIIQFVGDEYCFLKVLAHPENSSNFLDIWKAAYPAGLSYGILCLLFFLIREKQNQIRKDLYIMLIAYLLFFPTTLIIIYFFNIEGGYTASVMCATAFLSALVTSIYSLRRSGSEKLV